MRRGFRQEFHSNIMGLTKEAIANKRSIAAEIDGLRNKIESGKYSKEHCAELETKRRALVKQLEDYDIQVLREVDSLIADVKKNLEAETALNGADIHADAQLLSFGLNEKELLALLDKHNQNPTMTQLIFKNAKERGIDLPVHFVGNADAIKAAESAHDAVKVSIRHFNNDAVFNQIFCEGNSLQRTFDVDDREWRDKPVIDYSSDRVANAVRLLSAIENLSDSVQVDLVREFEGQAGVLSVLRNAAETGGHYKAVEEIDRLTKI